MRENRPYGSEGGEANAFPTPIDSIDEVTQPTAGNRAADRLMITAHSRSNR